MPTYEYVCKACDHEFERDQRISDPPIKTCPKCKAKQVKRLISRTSFHLKGGGWYSDLYAKPGKSAKSDGESSGAGEAKSESTAGDAAKPEKKPEKKADKKPAKSGSGSGSSGTGGSGSKAAA
jgi:putative FmdB family regulatory protein